MALVCKDNLREIMINMIDEGLSSWHVFFSLCVCVCAGGRVGKGMCVARLEVTAHIFFHIYNEKFSQ